MLGSDVLAPVMIAKSAADKTLCRLLRTIDCSPKHHPKHTPRPPILQRPWILIVPQATAACLSVSSTIDKGAEESADFIYDPVARRTTCQKKATSKKHLNKAIMSAQKPRGFAMAREMDSSSWIISHSQTSLSDHKDIQVVSRLDHVVVTLGRYKQQRTTAVLTRNSKKWQTRGFGICGAPLMLFLHHVVLLMFSLSFSCLSCSKAKTCTR